ncbi:MAG: hypothetical protein PHS44_07120, partial [Candidatus Dojkabacteria bacterium]|nr:hypothetical protein [Candidatus Dojkabacteria bacterium]
NPCNYLKYRAGHLCSGNSSIDWPYTGTSFYITQYFHSNHEALDLVKGYGSSIVASHDGYYFEETPSCSNSWCSVGCKTPTNPCVKVCQKADCSSGKVTIYCHVNFL